MLLNIKCVFWFPLQLLSATFLDAFAKLRNANISFVLSVRPSFHPSEWKNSAPAGPISMKLDVFFENLSIKFNFHYNLKIITGTLHEDRYTVLIILSSVLLRMIMFWTKFVKKNQNIILCSTTFFFSKIVGKYGTARQATDDNIYGTARQATDDNIRRCMHITYWIPKTINTHSEYVILVLHGNDNCTNAPHCYNIRILPVLFIPIWTEQEMATNVYWS